jgi:hypothetical protein
VEEDNLKTYNKRTGKILDNLKDLYRSDEKTFKAIVILERFLKLKSIFKNFD